MFGWIDTERREETLHTGPDAIVAVLLKLPATSHPLSDASKFVVDTWQQPGPSETLAQVLTVVVHGEFAERMYMLTFLWISLHANRKPHRTLHGLAVF